MNFAPLISSAGRRFDVVLKHLILKRLQVFRAFLAFRLAGVCESEPSYVSTTDCSVWDDFEALEATSALAGSSENLTQTFYTIGLAFGRLKATAKMARKQPIRYRRYCFRTTSSFRISGLAY